jgi:glutamine amidotransferase
LDEVAPELRRYILGETDSEVLFYLFLSTLAQAGHVSTGHSQHGVMAALASVVARVRALCDDGDMQSLLTLMATDGELLVATQGGKELFFSTYKRHCSDRDRCQHLSAVCESPSITGQVNHFIVSSEPLQGEIGWNELAPGDIIGIERAMCVSRSHVSRRELPVIYSAGVSTSA